jgi:hypothetical protein
VAAVSPVPVALEVSRDQHLSVYSYGGHVQGVP